MKMMPRYKNLYVVLMLLSFLSCLNSVFLSSSIFLNLTSTFFVFLAATAYGLVPYQSVYKIYKLKQNKKIVEFSLRDESLIVVVEQPEHEMDAMIIDEARTLYSTYLVNGWTPFVSKRDLLNRSLSSFWNDKR